GGGDKFGGHLARCAGFPLPSSWPGLTRPSAISRLAQGGVHTAPCGRAASRVLGSSPRTTRRKALNPTRGDSTPHPSRAFGPIHLLPQGEKGRLGLIDFIAPLSP